VFPFVCIIRFHYAYLVLRWGEAQLRKCLKREIVVLIFHPSVASAVGQHGYRWSYSRSGRFGYILWDLLDRSVDFFIRMFRRSLTFRSYNRRQLIFIKLL
jgi:hypothetical protein